MVRYSNPCAVDGCHGRPHGRSPLCAKHHYRLISHGDALQEPIFPKLSEPVARLNKWGKSVDGKRAIDAAVAQYVRLAELKLQEWQSDYAEMVRTGILHSSPHHETTELVANTYQTKDTRKTVVQLLALGILLEEGPQSFRSDAAFLCEATHVFLRGSAARMQYKYRENDGRRKAITRYLRKKTRLELGRFLTREIVWLGVLIHREWTRKGADEKKAKDELIAAIRGDTEEATA